MSVKASDIQVVEAFLLDLQQNICEALEALDEGHHFADDYWKFKSGGGGNSKVLESGHTFEKAGVNFSSIRGQKLPAAATEQKNRPANRPFTATGVSVVIHPRNPYVPTTHLNLRFIHVDRDRWWFGGGFDLTPYYGFEEDVVHWHRNAATACQGFGEHLYPKFKKWCDEYFFLKHRNETRGVGGLFFDDFKEGGFDNGFAFLQSVGQHFLKAYIPIVEVRKDCSFGPRERNFQLMRRGRYVEFNLLYDRGTLFGLQSTGRTESILMSLPPRVCWHYDWKAEPGSAEERLVKDFLKPRDWLAEQL